MADINVKKKIKIRIILIAAVLTFIFFVGYNLKNKESKLSGNSNYDINKIVDQIISDETSELDKKDLKEIQKEIQDNKIEKSDIVKVNFILGSVDLLNDDNKSAIEKFKRAKNSFNKFTEPRFKVWVNYKLFEAYVYNEDYEKADEIFDNAINICKNEYTKEALVDLYILGRPHMLKMPNGVAKLVELCDDAIRVSEKINYKLAEVYSMAGVVNAVAGNTIKSIEYKLKAIELSKKEEKKELEMQNNVEIAVSYMDLENYKEATKYLETSLGYSTGDKAEEAYFKSYALVNLIESYVKVDEPEKAQKSIDLLEKTVEDLSDKVMKEDNITVIYALKSQVELKNKNYIEAKKLLDESTNRYEKNANKFTYIAYDIYLAEIYGDIYYESKNYKEALKYHKSAEELAMEMGTDYYDTKHAKQIYLDYQGLNDYENANKYMTRYIELKNDITSDHDRQYTEYLHKKFEDEKKQEKILNLEQNKRNLYFVIIVLTIISVTIGIMGRDIYNKNKEINKLNELFKNLSVTDGLTGIPNRRALDEYLAGNWALYRKTQMPISFAMLDIDFFKKYNDNYGHPEGDKALEAIAKCMKTSARHADFIARYGGEEFTIVMLNTDEYESINVIEKIKKDIHELNIKHEYSDVSDRITLSIGISTAHIGSVKDYGEYIKKADNALYKAKQKGRNCCVHINRL